MSNQAVGPIYQRIIAEVINNSQADFEDGGVSRTVLDELRNLWQQKLSSLKVAQFPWEPEKPSASVAATPTNPTNAPPMTPTNRHNAQAQPGSGVPTSSASGTSTAVGELTKPPSSTATNSSALPPLPSVPKDAPAAMQRASSLLQQKFGSQANESIGALQSAPKAGSGSSSKTDGGPQSAPPPNGSVTGAQADGATEVSGLDEWTTARALSRVEGGDDGMGRAKVDDLIRQMVEEGGLQLEGGGLLLPLRQHHPRSRPTKRPEPTGNYPSSSSSSSSTAPRPTAPVFSLRQPVGPTRSSVQFDGAVDTGLDGSQDRRRHELSDEDAINSDLDDPDEDADADADHDESMQIMICMYDKVTRTKNKWKCTLKDGVLTVGGREYVFQKATGEFEW